MKKVYIVGGDSMIAAMFRAHGWEIVSHMKDADLVQFTGGEDVSPYLYGEEKHPYTYNSQYRDRMETVEFERAKDRGKPMAGICRGGQFLNVMSGGRMYQHVGKHTQDHLITDLLSNSQIIATSTHHQMMRPSSDGLLVAFASQSGFKQSMEDDKVIEVDEPLDTEVVFYPHTKALCFQPHPEYVSKTSSLSQYYFQLLDRFFGEEDGKS